MKHAKYATSVLCLKCLVCSTHACHCNPIDICCLQFQNFSNVTERTSSSRAFLMKWFNCVTNESLDVMKIVSCFECCKCIWPVLPPLNKWKTFFDLKNISARGRYCPLQTPEQWTMCIKHISEAIFLPWKVPCSFMLSKICVWSLTCKVQMLWLV